LHFDRLLQGFALFVAEHSIITATSKVQDATVLAEETIRILIELS